MPVILKKLPGMLKKPAEGGGGGGQHHYDGDSKHDHLNAGAPPPGAISTTPVGADALKPLNFDVVKQPKKPKTPREVHVSIKVISVSNISNVEQKFTADFELTLRWIDPAMIGVRNTPTPDWNKPGVWNPKVSIKNALELAKLEDSVVRKVEDPKIGLVRESARYRGAMAEYLELEEFPFDQQDLTIVVASPKAVTSLQFISPTNDQVRVGRFLLPEWAMKPPKWEVVTTDAAESSEGKIYSELHIKLQARRLWSSYIWNVGLVVGMIVSLCFLTFCIPLEEVSSRLSTTLTLLLTAVAFKFVVSESLPKIAYLTLMDKYMLVAFTVLYLIAIENGVISLAPRGTPVEEGGDGKGLAHEIDQWFIVSLAIVWVIYHVYVFFIVYNIYSGHLAKDAAGERELKERIAKEETDRAEKLAALSPRTRATHAALVGATSGRGGNGNNQDSDSRSVIDFNTSAVTNPRPGSDPQQFHNQQQPLSTGAATATATAAGAGSATGTTNSTAAVSIPLVPLSSHSNQQPPNPLLAQPPPLTTNLVTATVTLQPPPAVLVAPTLNVSGMNPPAGAGAAAGHHNNNPSLSVNPLAVPRPNPLLAPLTPRSAEQQAALVAAAGSNAGAQ